MKRIFLSTIILSIAFGGTLVAQEADNSEEGTVPEAANTTVDVDNPGMALLDQATDAKLRASTILDLSQVIALCQRAKNAGLSGENLRYCHQLLASSQLQRGLFLAQQLLNPNNVRPGDWQALRQRALSDIEEAVAIIKDQPTAFLRIAQLNMMPDGDTNRAKQALALTIQSAKNEPNVQLLATRLLIDLEPEAGKRETILSDAAKSGNPHVVLLYALTLLELGRNDDAMNVLRQLIIAESGNVELHEHIVAALLEVRAPLMAISILDTLHERADNDRKNRIDLMKAELLNFMEQYEDALALLNSLSEKVRRDSETTVKLLILRSKTHFALENLDEALKDIETAEQASSSFPPVLEQKYQILVAQDNYNDALAIAKKLQALNASPPNFLLEIHALMELGRYDSAIEAVQLLREKFPENDPLWISLLVEMYSKQQAHDKALALVEEQLEDNPDELRWILAKAGVYSGQKKWDEATNWLETQLQRNSDSLELQLALIGVLADRKSFRAARERLRPLLTQEPDNLRLLRIDSQLSISLGLHSDAVRVLTKIVEAAPSDFTSINNLAWVLATSPIDSVRNGRRAVELAEKAGELTRYKRAFVLSTLAAAHAEAGDFVKAREWAKTSVDVAKKEKGKTEEERKELLEHLQKEWDAFSQDMPFRELLNEESE